MDILTGHVETQEEIEERLGASGRDPLALAVHEIIHHLGTIHQLAGARAQQITICRELLPMFTEAEGYLEKGCPANAGLVLGKIRAFVEAGALG